MCGDCRMYSSCSFCYFKLYCSSRSIYKAYCCHASVWDYCPRRQSYSSFFAKWAMLVQRLFLTWQFRIFFPFFGANKKLWNSGWRKRSKSSGVNRVETCEAQPGRSVRSTKYNVVDFLGRQSISNRKKYHWKKCGRHFERYQSVLSVNWSNVHTLFNIKYLVPKGFLLLVIISKG